MVYMCKWNFMVFLAWVSLLFREINAASGNLPSNVGKRKLIHRKLPHESLCLCVMKTRAQCLDENRWELLLNESAELFKCMIPCINVYGKNYHKSEYTIDIQTLHPSIITIEDVENALKQIETFENVYKEYNRILKQYLVPTLLNNSLHECFSDNNIKFLANVNEKMHKKFTILRNYEIFVKYVHLVIVVLISILGLSMDGMFIYILLKHKKLTKKFNVVLLNLAIIDLIGLVCLLPQYFLLRDLVRYFDLVVQFNIVQTGTGLAGAFSVITLSFLRYKGVSYSVKWPKSKLSYKEFPYITIIIIWLNFVLPFILLLEIPELIYNNQEYIIICIWFYLGVIFPIIVSVINFLTSRKLKQCAKNIPGEGTPEAFYSSRYRSSRLVIGLCAIAWIAYTPLYVGSIVFKLDLFSPSEEFKYLLIFAYFATAHNFWALNATLNPLSVYITSKKFRTLFRTILFGSVEKDENKDI